MSDYKVAPYSQDAMPEQISPEGSKIANTYLSQACSMHNTARVLNLPTEEIAATLETPLVKRYVNGVLREHGYQHMTAISSKLDDLIERKWEELEEAEIGSNKDIAELLQIAHKFRLDMAKLLQADIPKPQISVQRNTQQNYYGENYATLMHKLSTD